MSLYRNALIVQLKTILSEITEIKTVIRSYKEIDITQYASSNLPLIEIQEPEEITITQQTSMRAMMGLNISLRIFFVNWGENPSSTYETLISKIRNKIGDHFTLNNTATGTWIDRISKVDGTMPLFNFTMDLTCHYYLDQKST